MSQDSEDSETVGHCDSGGTVRQWWDIFGLESATSIIGRLVASNVQRRSKPRLQAMKIALETIRSTLPSPKTQEHCSPYERRRYRSVWATRAKDERIVQSLMRAVDENCSSPSCLLKD